MEKNKKSKKHIENKKMVAKNVPREHTCFVVYSRGTFFVATFVTIFFVTRYRYNNHMVVVCMDKNIMVYDADGKQKYEHQKVHKISHTKKCF